VRAVQPVGNSRSISCPKDPTRSNYALLNLKDKLTVPENEDDL
jgi:hypothetical protein